MRKTKKLVLTALFMSLGLVLPILTGQIKQIGNMLLPMHLPVFLCGLICGWQYGLVLGLILPPLRSLIFSMPPMFPTAAAMAFELATYGFVSGLLYAKAKRRNIGAVYLAMIIAMLSGRIVWGAVMTLLLGVGKFTFQAFLTGAFINAVPGIIIQLVLIPAIMTALNKAGLINDR